MIEVFTKDVVKDMGKNVGKAASKKILDDLHSIMGIRWVVSFSSNNTCDVLGFKVGEYKYDNKLDRLIENFKFIGKGATIKAGHNIYNTYFSLVDKTYKDGVLGIEEVEFLVWQYHRTVSVLYTISMGLIESGDEGESLIVINKILLMQEFMSVLDKNFICNPVIEEKSDNILLKTIFFSAVITLVMFVFFIPIWLLEVLSISMLTKNLLWVFCLLKNHKSYISW